MIASAVNFYLILQLNWTGSKYHLWKEGYDGLFKKPTFHYERRKSKSIDTGFGHIGKGCETTTDPRPSDTKFGLFPRGSRQRDADSHLYLLLGRSKERGLFHQLDDW
jgi:hypothetical protein